MRILLAFILVPFLAVAQPKGAADKLYEDYEGKPYISSFALGGSWLSKLPIDIEFDKEVNGVTNVLEGEVKRIQFLRTNDEDRAEECYKAWLKFLKRKGYKRIVIPQEDGDDMVLYVRGTRKRFDEVHIVSLDGQATFITVYGDFTLKKKSK